jgi:hypothetical protein
LARQAQPGLTLASGTHDKALFRKRVIKRPATFREANWEGCYGTQWSAIASDAKEAREDRSARSGEKRMKENFEPAVESLVRTVSELGAQAKDKLTAQVRREPAKTFSLILAGSIVISVLIGYRISRLEEESRRERFVEDWMQEVTNWIREHGGKMAAPIRGGLAATKSAVEDISNSSAKAGRQLHPFFEKQKRSFLNLF